MTMKMTNTHTLCHKDKDKSCSEKNVVMTRTSISQTVFLFFLFENEPGEKEGDTTGQLDTRSTIPDQSTDPRQIDSETEFGQYFTSDVFPIRQQNKIVNQYHISNMPQISGQTRHNKKCVSSPK